MNVLVYTGAGTSKGSADLTLKLLRSMLSLSYDVIPVDANVLTKEPWQATASLLVIPGGRDLPFVDSLSPIGTSLIKDWVRKGGKYLGICAGAYFACSKVEFEVGRSGYQVVGSRDLGFFQGVGRGSVTPEFVYHNDTNQGARAAKVSINLEALSSSKDPTKPILNSGSTLMDLYVNGGPYFDCSTSSSSIASSFAAVSLSPKDPSSYTTTSSTESPPNKPLILATYTSNVKDFALNQPAIIECSPGLGKAILVGPHIEIGSSDIPPDPCFDSQLRLPLTHSDEDRKFLVRALLTRLGLRLNNDEGNSLLEENSQPVHSPMYLCVPPSQPPSTVSIIHNWLHSHLFPKSTLDRNQYVLKDTVNTIHFLQEDGKPIPRPDSEQTVNVVWNSTFQPPAPTSTPLFNISSYFETFEALQSKLFGENKGSFGSALLYAQTIGSTQTFLEKNGVLASSLPVGLVCVGSHQFQGRGRGRNSWISQTGCLQFSLSIKHSNPSSALFIQYLFGLAVVEAIRSKPGYSEIPIRLKWPNDIYCEYQDPNTNTTTLKKIGGILVNSSYSNGEFEIVIGCGINISNSRPTICVNDLIRQHPTLLPELSMEQVLGRILPTFEKMYNTFRDFKTYGYTWAFEGFVEGNQKVTLQDQGGVQARILGLDTTGLLKAVNEETGEEHLLQPDGNSFDMLKGLISTKK
ncbi:biotin holocarboxylase synthetase [Chytridiales sp. JEL 0842]|nr:biotin holocarboxylase synthetase [Chytridiales sp. JEL 0842]